MEDFSVVEPELVDAEDVLQAFEEQGLGPVNDPKDLPVGIAKHLPRLPASGHDGPSLPADQPPGAAVHSPPAAAEPALQDLPSIRPPSPAASPSISVLPYKRPRNAERDLILLRMIASVPLTPRSFIDWKLIQARLQGTVLGDLTCDKLLRSFRSLIHRVDNGQLPWPNATAEDTQEGQQLIALIKQSHPVGLGGENVPLLHAQVPAFINKVNVTRPPRKISFLPNGPKPRVAARKIVSVQSLIRPVDVDEELTRRSHNVEEYVSGRLRFIPNLGSWRAKYIDSKQLAALQVLTDNDGDVEAASHKLGMTPAALERCLDEWIIERKSKRDRRDASPVLSPEI